MTPSRRALLPFAVVLLSACSVGQSVVGGGADAAPDVVDVTVDDLAADVGLDAPKDAAPLDVVDAPDAGPDVLPDVAPDVERPCTTSTDCATSPLGPVCDVAAGRCVRCLPTMDVCPADQHCDGASRSCVPGCHSDDGCPHAAGDAGVDGGAGRGQHCDTNSRACVECLTDEHCPAGTLCVGSVCTVGCTTARPCPTGQQCCGGGCVDPLSNTAHCGGCDMRCTVTNGTAACLNGVCSVGMCASPFGDCDAMIANGCEANTLTDVNHCGGCGMACPTRAHASSSCAGGRCTFACDEGFADCDMNPANGCESDLRNDITRCGACGTTCNPPNGVPSCVEGRCAVASCATGYGDCDGNPTNGCESDLRSTTAHCGVCTTACGDRPNAFPGCLAGRCVTSCVMGFLDCDGDAANGCEADLRTDGANCGACGRACDPAHGAGACTAGRCVLSRCDMGFADCDGDVSNGCEVNTRSDTANCGTCRNACSVTGGTAACTAGVCGLATCRAGLGDCDMNGANGCEVDLSTDARNCGGCGTVCDLANATATCVGGRCAVGSCAAGFADCDANPANGCETDTRSSTAACGGCGAVCAPANASPACRDGRCAIGSCNPGFADCDANPANGCETNLSTTVSSCGSCGAACALAHATPACASARCLVASCESGYADCDMSPATGCEIDQRNDPRNCGACGRACSLANTSVAGCAGGACTVVTCAAGYANCDGNAANGCEVSTLTDARNCGGCGTVCPTGVCRDGVCESFAGAYETSDPTCASCNNGNPFTSSSCGCPSGFSAQGGFRVINDCPGRGTQHGANITLCGGPATGDYAGGFQSDDAVAGGLGCRAANPYTGGCSCPGGSTAVRFRTLTDSSRGIIGSSITFCVNTSAPRASYGGAYQVDDGVPGGVGCRAANPVTGACTCPAGTGGQALRVEVDASTGFIGSVIVVCVR